MVETRWSNATSSPVTVRSSPAPASIHSTALLYRIRSPWGAAALRQISPVPPTVGNANRLLGPQATSSAPESAEARTCRQSVMLTRSAIQLALMAEAAVAHTFSL